MKQLRIRWNESLDETMRKRLRGIGAAIERGLQQTKSGKKTGYALFVFDFGTHGHMSYISNARRGDMVNAQEEWLLKQYEEQQVGVDDGPYRITHNRGEEPPDDWVVVTGPLDSMEFTGNKVACTAVARLLNRAAFIAKKEAPNDD